MSDAARITTRLEAQLRQLPDQLKGAAASMVPFRGADDDRDVTVFAGLLKEKFDKACAAVKDTMERQKYPKDVDAVWGHTFVRVNLCGAAGDWFDAMAEADVSMGDRKVKDLTNMLMRHFKKSPQRQAADLRKFYDLKYDSTFVDIHHFIIKFMQLAHEHTGYEYDFHHTLDQQQKTWLALKGADEKRVRRPMFTVLYTSMPQSVRQRIDSELLQWDEEQRDCVPKVLELLRHVEPRPPAAASKTNRGGNGSNHNGISGNSGNSAAKHKGGAASSRSSTNNGSRSDVTCGFCLHRGHTKDVCRTRLGIEQRASQAGAASGDSAATATTSGTNNGLISHALGKQRAEQLAKEFIVLDVNLTLESDDTLTTTGVLDTFSSHTLAHIAWVPDAIKHMCQPLNNDDTLDITSATGDKLNIVSVLNTTTELGCKLTILLCDNLHMSNMLILGMDAVVPLNVQLFQNYTPVAPTGTTDHVCLAPRDNNALVLAAAKGISELDMSHLPPPQRARLTNVLGKHSRILYTDGSPLTFPPVPNVTHKIELTDDAVPVHVRARNVPLERHEALQGHLHQLQAAQHIQRARPSEWSSPIVLVPKKDGTLRMCIDYSNVNKFTKSDTYRVPNAHDLLKHYDAGERHHYFVNLDIKSAFNCIEMHPDSVRLTAFATPFGSYQCKRMPFGFCTAPATFLRAIDGALEGVPTRHCRVYFDDILLSAATLDKLFDVLDEVLLRLNRNNLRVNLGKCKFGVDSVAFLGHTVTSNGLMIAKGKSDAVSKMPPPTSVKDVRAFLGIVSYLRDFVPQLAAQTVALRAATTNVATGSKFVLTDDMRAEIDALKLIITSAPVLGQYELNRKHAIATDASIVGIGAVLLQLDDEQRWTPIEYYSRTTSAAERNYPVHELEGLAVVVALRRWRPLLYVPPRNDTERITIFTDSMIVVNTLAADAKYDEDAEPPRRRRWRELLRYVNPEFKHVPGKNNSLPDALSRMPLPATTDEIDASDIDNLLDDMAGIPQPFTARAADDGARVSVAASTTTTTTSAAPAAVIHTLRQVQPRCTCAFISTCSTINCACRKASRPCSSHCSCTSAACTNDGTHSENDETVSDDDDDAIATDQNEFSADTDESIGADDDMRLSSDTDDGKLKDDSGDKPAPKRGHQPAPYEAQPELHARIKAVHDAYLHPGAAKTAELVKREFDVDEKRLRDACAQYVQQCEVCQLMLLKGPRTANTLTSIVTSKPNELVHLDIVTNLPVSDAGNSQMLTMIDNFTKFAVVVPLPHSQAPLVTKMFIDNWLLKFGAPHCVLTDMGANLISDEFATLCAKFGIRQIRTNAYRPEGNGVCERFNQSIVNYIRIAIADANIDPHGWDALLPACLFVYNALPHSTIGMSPFELVFNRKPRLITDMMQEQPDTDDGDVKRVTTGIDTNVTVADLTTAARAARMHYEHLVSSALKHTQDTLAARRRKHSDTTSPPTIVPGNLVLVRRHKGIKDVKLKVSQQWAGPFVVVRADPAGTIQLAERSDDTKTIVRTEHVRHTKLYYKKDKNTNAGGVDDSARREVGERRLFTSLFDFVLPYIDYKLEPEPRAASQPLQLQQHLDYTVEPSL